MYEFKLPDLGEGIHEAEILRWYLAPGEEIARDAPLVDVETDKAAVTLPCPVAGRVVSLAGAVGEVLHVGDVVAVIDEGSAADVPEATQKAPAPPVAVKSPPAASRPAPSDAAKSPPAASPPAPSVAAESPPAAPPPAPSDAAKSPPAASPPAPPVAAESPPASPPSEPFAIAQGPRAAAPATRRLARELNVDLRGVEATGPGGRVTSEDVHRASAGALAAAGGLVASRGVGSSPASLTAVEPHASPSPTQGAAAAAGGPVAGIPLLEVEPLQDFSVFGPVEKEPLRSIRRKVARRMTQASILVAQVSHTDEADVTELDALRRRERERRAGREGARLTLMAFVMKAVVAGLKQHRAFNASLDALREEIIYKRYYNLGVAVDGPRGLVVPVIRDANGRSVLELATALEDLASRARQDRLEASDFRGGTFTISNIGNIGGFSPNPIVSYPEVALLGMGRAEPKPVVVGGEIVIRTRLPLVLSFDHRVADGGDAARFMNDLKRRLEDPATLLVEG